MSDAALSALESAAAAKSGATSRLLCSSESREHWFLGRAEHIRSFLMDQAKALGGQGAPARAAVTTADGDAAGAAGGQGAPTPVATVSDTDCRLQVARADRASSSVAPTEYHGPNAQHGADTKAEFEKRKTCFACLNTGVQYGTFHLECRQHGRQATLQQRADKALRVPGSPSTLNSF